MIEGSAPNSPAAPCGRPADQQRTARQRAWCLCAGTASVLAIVPLLWLTASANDTTGLPHTPADQAGAGPTARRYLPMVANRWSPPRTLTISLGHSNVEHGLSLDTGGDVDTEVVIVGTPPTEARRTGNGRVLPSRDGNSDEDWYMQFRADNAATFAAKPTERLVIEVEYLDKGTDSFRLEYDAASGGPFGTGLFADGGSVTKSNSGRFVTAVFRLCNAYFADRDNGADFRISDDDDGAETIRSVRVTLLPPGPALIDVASCGANPWDALPDSAAIQACFDQACDGDTVTLAGSSGRAGYQGYLVDKTLFLATAVKSDLTFTSKDADDRALLKATADLKGYVVRLYARSRVGDAGGIDDITLRHLAIDGGRSVRTCFGADGIDNGIGDDWGSWLPECSAPGDPWCLPGSLAMDGQMDWGDIGQNYTGNPSKWSTELVVEDVLITQTECGSALALGGAACTIRDSIIDAAGDHVHAAGCALVDPDEPKGAWSDGITFSGPGHLITRNSITDASDVGIVFFGGKNTVISNNTVRASSGNHGMFAGIAIHPWIFGDVSGSSVVGNQVANEGDESCGGIHAGINLGTHMWGAGCVNNPNPSTVGIPGQCLPEGLEPRGSLCSGAALCQVWAHVAPGRTFTLKDNYAAGAQINYLIEGVDLMGTLVKSGNRSGTPRPSDWEGDAGCWSGSSLDTWGPLDKVAHHPSLAGWTDQRVHCER
jgi:hypothetical protein